MTAAKKKTRKELLKEPDEFLTLSSRLLSLAARYRRQVLYVGIGLLAVGVIFSAYRLWSNRAEAAASVLLDQAVSKSERITKEQSAEKAHQETAADFKTVIEGHGRTASGRLARLMYGNLCFAAGDTAQAIDLFKAALDQFAEHPLIHHQILKSLGYCHERLKDYAAAAGYFERALAAGVAPLQDEVLFQLGEIYQRMGKTEQSRAAFDRILTEHKESAYLELVRERLSG